MDFLKIAKRRSVISDVIYNGLNIALAAAVLGVILVSGSLLPAFALILLSKWRVLAVRLRYWSANIQANLVDVIVSVGLAVLIYVATGNMGLQVFIALLYVGWLLFLKPRSKRSFIIIQAGVAVVVGVTALYTVSYGWIASPVVLGMWLIGYATARHVLSAYDETHISFLSLIWGLIVAELGWVAYHWTFAYNLPGFGTIQLPQITLIILALSFVAERFYTSYHQHNTVRLNDLLLPILLSGSVVAVLLLFLNTASIGGL